MNSTSTSLSDKLRDHNGIMVVIQLIQAVLITGANTLLVAVYIVLGPLQRRNGNYLILSQAFADLFIGALLWFEIIAFKWLNLQSRNSIQVLYSGMLEYSFSICVGTLLVNAIERHILVTRPIYHKHNVTVYRLQWVTLSLWAASLIPAMCLVGLMQFDIRQSNSGRVIRYSYVFDVIMLVMLSAIASIHWQSLKNANKHNNFQHSDVEYGEMESESSTRSMKDTKLIKLFIVTMIIFTITYTPIFFGRLIFDVGGFENLDYFQHTILINVCHILYKLSAICNPVLGLCVKRDYRNKVNICCTSTSDVENEHEEDGEEDLMLTEMCTSGV